MRLEARSLVGRPCLLPEDLEGHLNLLLVGFGWWQQEVIDSWLPPLEELAARRTDLRIYELVVIPRSYLPARPSIDGGMARGIPGEAVRARTLTAYTDLPRALARLGLQDTRDVALFLVERTRTGLLAGAGRPRPRERGRAGPRRRPPAGG